MCSVATEHGILKKAHLGRVEHRSSINDLYFADTSMAKLDAKYEPQR